MPETNTNSSRGRPNSGQELLDRGEDGVVPATGAPPHLLIGLEVGSGVRRGGHLIISRIFSSISATLNGSPATLFRPLTSSRNSDLITRPQLTGVQLGDQDLLVGIEDLAEVGRQGVEVAKVGGRHLLARQANPTGRGPDRPVGRPPPQDQDLGVGVTGDLDLGDVVGDVGHLPGPGVGHQLVVGRLIRHVAADGLLLQPADPMLQAGSARDRPGSGEGVDVPHVGEEDTVGPVGVLGELHRDRRQAC